MAEPLIDPDCRDGKHSSCVGGPCECVHHEVADILALHRAVMAEIGRDATAAWVMIATGLTVEDLDRVGGIGS